MIGEYVSNDAFHHQNEKVSQALKATVGVMVRHGNRKGFRKIEDFAPAILERLHPTCREKLGATPQAQLETMQMALPIAVSRSLIGHDPANKSLFRTRKGVRARKTHLVALNQAKKKSERRKTLGMPAYAH